MRITFALLWFTVCVSLSLSADLFAQGPSAQELLIKAIEAERKNRDLMVNYLFRETVQVHYQCGPKAKMRDQLKVFEVIMLEGQPYFQLVEEDGAPLYVPATRSLVSVAALGVFIIDNYLSLGLRGIAFIGFILLVSIVAHLIAGRLAQSRRG